MAGIDPWSAIHAERKALVADLEPLSDAQWSTPSMCGGWSVQQVLGHMTATAKMTPPKFFGAFLGSGFSFDKMTSKEVARETAGSGAATLNEFRNYETATSHPPGPVMSWLGETVIHAEDIRRPLGIAHEYPVDALTALADFYRGSNLIVGGKSRVAGLSLRGTDADWTAGEGPEVAGPMLAMVQAITGRKAALDALSGDGVETLRTRK